jgi:hypothetical protein
MTLWLDQLVSHREIIVGLTILSSADHPEAFLLSGFFSSFSKQDSLDTLAREFLSETQSFIAIARDLLAENN